VRASKHGWIEVPEQRITGQGIKKMRFSLAVAVVLAGISVSGLAQQNNTIKVKPAAPEKPPRSTVPVGKTTGAASSSSANSKDLQTLERQTARSAGPSRTAGQKKAPALKPVKDKPNPPINFAGTGGAKTTGTTSQGANPYRGRLKQKHAHQ
jgi:hypothetical protein